MNKDAGRKWPLIIALAIMGVVFLSIVTIKIAINNPVEMSDYGMQNYHQYDANANDIINAKIQFDQRYNVSLLTAQIHEHDTVIEYKVTDKNGTAVDNAQFDVVLTRPDTIHNDINLSLPSVKSGVYTFSPVDLSKPGRWDIMAKITIGNDKKYYNLKADTRYPQIFEF
ncbi:MAG: FixH family protein [Sulfuricurvum sp.]